MGLIKTVKNYTPSFVLQVLRDKRFKRKSKKFFKYDRIRFVRLSNSHYRFNTAEKLIGQITAEYHAVEKGLVMREIRFGFGEKVILNLISHCKLYSEKYGKDSEQLNYAIQVIVEYRDVHNGQTQTISNVLKKSINEFLHEYKDIIAAQQLYFTKGDYFKHQNGSFFDFSNSRHSLRNFSGPVETKLIEQAVSLAQNSPSACNRQPSRVYLFNDRDMISRILALQQGNRGFGYLVGNLIIVTSEIGGFLGLEERNDVYTNGGIYAMNLLYALHFFKVGACMLNWSSLPDQDLQLRKLCKINSSESVILFIACGDVPESFKVATSPRCDSTNILTSDK